MVPHHRLHPSRLADEWTATADPTEENGADFEIAE